MKYLDLVNSYTHDGNPYVIIQGFVDQNGTILGRYPDLSSASRALIEFASDKSRKMPLAVWEEKVKGKNKLISWTDDFVDAVYEARKNRLN